MEQSVTKPQKKKISRWLVPLAALIVLGYWLSIAPPGLLGKADAVGYAVCHRIDERSFHVFGRQLPLCARCTGEFYAAAITLFFLTLVSPKKSGMPDWKIGTVLVIFLAAFAIDGANSYLYLLKETAPGALDQIPNLYIPNNTLRLFTGSGMGIAIAAVLFPAFNGSIWRHHDPAPSLDWRKLGTIIAIITILNLLILSEQPAILLPIAIISVLGVLSLLTMVFGMMWVMIMRQENTFEKWTQLWLPLLAGATLAFILITVIDLLRFKLTGTWGGFPLG